jgi:serine/threonine protein kinase
MDDEIAKDAVPSSGAAPPRLPVIPDHELLKCIGEGSYGQIWLVRNILGSYRAAKVVFRDKFKSVQPFEREFQGIRIYEPISRTHESLLQVLQVGKNDQEGYFYYVMDLADDQFTRQTIYPEMYVAKTLENEIRLRGRLPAKECVKVGLELTAALQHLHERGLVHRDIKPANLIYSNGRIKLADIGLVADVRNAKTMVGTEGFIPPEGPGTVQADIFSMGKVLYEMVTGKDRFDFPAPSTRLGEFSDRKEVNQLGKVLYRACADLPRDRYRSARDLHRDLLKLDRQFSTESPYLWKLLVVVGFPLVGIMAVLAFALAKWGANAPVKQQSTFGKRVSQRTGPTNSLDLPSPIGRLFKTDSSQTAYLLVEVESDENMWQLISTNDTPKGLNVRSESASVWQCTESAPAYLLKSGTNLIPASMIMASSNAPGLVSQVLNSNMLVNVFAPTKSQILGFTLIFEVPRNLDPSACSYTYQGNASAHNSEKSASGEAPRRPQESTTNSSGK